MNHQFGGSASVTISHIGSGGSILRPSPFRPGAVRSPIPLGLNTTFGREPGYSWDPTGFSTPPTRLENLVGIQVRKTSSGIENPLASLKLGMLFYMSYLLGIG